MKIKKIILLLLMIDGSKKKDGIISCLIKSLNGFFKQFI